MKEINDNSKKNYIFSSLIISYFSNLGVRYAFLSPGSRNTPLSQALLNDGNIKTYSIIDERSSAFVALGKTKSDKYKRPVIIVTTSGTAVANLLPGIVESYMSDHPMIVITADRPKRLVDKGENQTIYQKKIFGRYTQFFDASSFIKNTQEHYENYKNDKDKLWLFICNIFSTSQIGPYDLSNGEFSPTPVHLNIPFDEPLYQKSDKFLYNTYKPLPIKNRYLSTSYDYPFIYTNSDSMGYQNKRILIICTDLCDSVIIKASEKYHVPIFMECRSARFNNKSKNIISSYDAILKNSNIKPDLILRFGSRPISKKLNEFINRNKQKTYLIQGNDGKKYVDGWVSSKLIKQYLNMNKKTIDKSWCDELIQMQEMVEENIQSFFKNPKYHEGYIINTIISTLPKNSNLMVGNSSPIRDLDSFTFNLDKKINIYSNRGASGIDGLISTAIGVSINNKSFNALIIGDVSFYYDLTALNIANNIPLSLTIFVMNNQGGHIFDRLDGLKNQSKSNYEKYWLTPVNLDIKSIAKAFNCHYHFYNFHNALVYFL